jgi:hypothetical protein
MEPPEFLSQENGGGKKFLLDNAHGEVSYMGLNHKSILQVL